MLSWIKAYALIERYKQATLDTGQPIVIARQGDPEPRNNDGRRHCWWCWQWTEKRQGFTATYDICPKCEK